VNGKKKCLIESISQVFIGEAANEKVSDRSQSAMTFDSSLSESAGSGSLDSLGSAAYFTPHIQSRMRSGFL